MKIVGNKNKIKVNKTLIIAIASAIAVIAIIVGLVIGLSGNKTPEATTTTTKKDSPISSISIEKLPKTEYYIGEEFDKTGFVLKITRKDGTTELIDANDPELKFSKLDSSLANESIEMRVEYKGFVAKFNVSVSRAPVVVEGTVTGISITSTPKSFYYVGETFDASGIVIAVTVAEKSEPYYVNGDYPEVEVSGFDSSVANDELPITVSYKGFTASYNVAIKDASFGEYVILSLTVVTKPKTTYYIGQEFDKKGMRIQVNTDKQATTFFVEADDEKLTISGFDSSVAVENQRVTVTYEGVSTWFMVTIKEVPKPTPTLVSIEVVDLIDSYSVERWNKNGLNLYGAYLKLTYSDGTVKGSYEETPLLWSYISPLSKVESAGTTEITVSYVESGVRVSATVTITITE